MEQPTPRDFLVHLNQGNYQAALDLANELELNKDIVYKTQWARRKEERGSQLQSKDVDLVSLVKDDAWVISQCLETCVNQSELQSQILTLGQSRVNKLTDPIIKKLDIKNKTADLSIADKTWLRSRLYFLQHSDRLQTLKKIWQNDSSTIFHHQTGDSTFATAYSQFRDVSLVAQAIEFARSENSTGLDAIFMHHGSEVLGHRLFILSQIPETADPSRFDLPHVMHDREDTWLEEPWRKEADIVELDWVKQLISLNVQEEIEFKHRMNEGIETTEYPTNSKVIAEWYLDRAHVADKIGLSSNALEISRYARVMGVTGIDDKIAQYEWLCKFVYGGGQDSDKNEFVSLDRFEKLSNYEVLQGLLSNTNVSTIVNDMLKLALPWIEVSKKKNIESNEKKEFLLYRWLLDPLVAESHLDWCCAVFEVSKPTIDIEDRIIKDDLDLSRLVLAIVYSSNGSMEYLVRLFECLPIFSNLVQNKKGPTDMASMIKDTNTPLDLFLRLQEANAYGLTTMMDALQNQLGSAETLTRYHSSVPLRWFLQDQSVESQRQLCIRMSSQAAGGVESGGAQFSHDDDWRELLDDMIRLCDDGQGVFGKLSNTEILEIFFSSLLRCGRFKLAKELILGSKKIMDINKAEKFVIDAEHEFFDNAASGSMNHGSMKQAWECLKILPPTTEIKKEMDLIEATHALISEYKVQDRLNMALMPIQIRQSKNRLELIAKLIHTKRDMYRHHEQVLELVRKLGYGDDLLAKVKAISMLASAALVEEEYIESYKLCKIAVEAAQNKPMGQPRSYNDQIDIAAWQTCLALGKVDAFEDMNRRLDVLSMAMTLSPVEHIRDVLVVWRKLDAQNPSQVELAQLNANQYENTTGQDSMSWQGLLQNATKQWSLGDLLGGENTNDNQSVKRKRDLLRDAVGSWLF